MAFLVRVSGGKKGIELGVFTGYTSLCFAEALPADGKLIAIDVSEEYTNLGRKYWKLAGVDDKIQLRLDGGVKVLEELLADPANLGTFDFAYIDADKPSYPVYLKLLTKLLRPGGFVMIDNVLWKGMVADPHLRETDEETKALYGVVIDALKSPEFRTHAITFSDGLAIAQKI